MTGEIKQFQPVTGNRKSLAGQLPDIEDDLAEALANVKAHTSDSDNDVEDEKISKTQPASAAEKAKAQLEKPVPRSEYEHMNIGLPPYIMEQLRLKSITDKSSVRYEILRGLREVGYDIRDADMIKDFRRGK